MATWFEKNPMSNPGFMDRTRWNAHVWGRQTFAKSFASGGFAATAFARNRREMITSPWRAKAPVGSYQYLQNLRDLQRVSFSHNPRNVNKAIRDVTKGKPKPMASGLLGLGVTAGIIGVMGATAQGGIHEKARAATAAIGGEIGWFAGAKAGMGIGAAVGSFLPVVGTAVGAAVGYIGGGLLGYAAGSEATDFLTRLPDRLVDKERSRRGLEWGNNIAAFQTRKAHTMRQQSLAAMNRGQMSARSLLGQEAVFVHR